MYQKNIGFYIYRNGRLISQALTLANICPRDQDHMALRIRIDLDTNCDEDVNLDVKKTKLEFSEKFIMELKNQLSAVVNESKNLWEAQSKTTYPKSAETTEADKRHARSNEKLATVQIGLSDDDSHQRIPVEKPFNKDVKAEYKPEKSIIEEIKDKSNHRVTNVQSLERNALWKPFIGSEDSDDVCVALSRDHSFYDKIYKELHPGSNEVILLDAFFLSLAMAEIGISASDKKLSKVFKKLRLTVSGFLEDFTEIQLEDMESDDKSEEIDE